MVGLGHYPMISKYGPSLSKAVGQVDLSFLIVKNLTLIKIIHFTAGLRISQNSNNLCSPISMTKILLDPLAMLEDVIH